MEAEAAGKEGIERAMRQLELNPRNLHVISLVASTYAMLNHREEALVWADRLLELTPPDGLVIYYNLACMYASLGMNEKAIDCLELHGFQAIDADWIEHDGDLDPLREHPRFVTLMAKITAHAAASDLSDTRS